MTRSASLVFHIGYHKTGTTWMQRRLFQPDCGYLPLMDHDEVFETITKPHPLAFDPALPRERIKAKTDADTRDLTPIISSEILSGHPFWGGRESVELAQRIKKIAPEAKIVITIREQVKIIASVYMQYVRRAGRLSPDTFFKGDAGMAFNGFDPVHFEYDRLLQVYQELFGADRVKVVTQEKLARDPAGFVADLAAFAGTDAGAKPDMSREGQSEKEACIWALRRVNYFREDGGGVAPIFNLGPVADLAYRGVSWAYRQPVAAKLGANKKSVTDRSRAHFGGRFGPSNQRLQALAGESLDLSGYEL